MASLPTVDKTVSLKVHFGDVVRNMDESIRGAHISHEAIIEFAQQLGIAPGIVVGRFQHDGRLEKANCNKLKRHLKWSGSTIN